MLYRAAACAALCLSIGGANALIVGAPLTAAAPRLRATLPAVMCDAAAATADAAPPEGFVEVEPDGSCPVNEEALYCNDEGCWVGTPPPVEPVVLPDGRTFCPDLGVMSHSEYDEKNPKKLVAKQGIFAPIVKGAKAVAGDKEINILRGKVIAEHTKVISAFVDTSDSKFGQIVVRKMFEAADKDNNGTLDKQEVKDALHALGFTFVEKKQIEQIFKRADENGDEVIDFEEFVKETPKTLRSSLIKLAKTNGHDLGFLA